MTNNILTTEKVENTSIKKRNYLILLIILLIILLTIFFTGVSFIIKILIEKKNNY